MVNPGRTPAFGPGFIWDLGGRIRRTYSVASAGKSISVAQQPWYLVRRKFKVAHDVGIERI